MWDVFIEGVVSNSPVVAVLMLLWTQQRRHGIALVKLAENIDGVSASEIKKEITISGD